MKKPQKVPSKNATLLELQKWKADLRASDRKRLKRKEITAEKLNKENALFPKSWFKKAKINWKQSGCRQKVF